MRGGKREGAGRKPGSSNKEKKMDAKSFVVRVRVTEEEKARINDCLKVTGKTESEFIRDAIAAEIESVTLSYAVVLKITGKEKKTR